MSLADIFDGYIVDLDGVVHLGWEPLPGAVDTLRELSRRGKRVVYLTNEPRYARTSITSRLRGFGLDVAADSVVTSGWAAAIRVAEGGASVYVIGSAELRAEVTRAGGVVLSAADASTADRILVAGHSDFSYAELRAACRAGAAGAELFAANRDATFPMPDGPWPATGAILAAVETALGQSATAVGKPEPAIFRLAQSRLGPLTTVVIGDRPDTDILGGRRAGLPTILVGSAPVTAETRPDHIIADLPGLLARSL
ncbi:HAD-IIA family hydrolase [Actinokineospora diospyrosa]|uniref:Haloacid Dehalogenase Superfamily Class (Subfamily) IIA/haloacid dehalogenase superfamily, subfamily IA, variant 1 with third motif having Dx(3-4)D or Dx(3-4)E n=1 Tax=Actinokineospora diospyrosa TaxID=103728 RepID=A0ABT1I679_9PSEU|nr:HAD-IIA family hydrolase [Actinokineospora diospyrosa]MCP2268087.1 Haloacid Dehalogenase Superfamily Class (subfamily) IIA/haloacid dehalogenase superfamily, subfamily IA, variant 1 with third motif having Dx(3-4)D or Dx(3-4)E [Actinokineospora diospyrosa]